MKIHPSLPLAAFATLLFAAASPIASSAQINIQIGPEPNCPYGYYDAAPFNCAPYGYYGPEWFSGGAFIGAGRWYHGPADFRGHVDNHFHPDNGYHGSFPEHGEHARPENNVVVNNNFHGNEMRDGRGHSFGGDDHGGGDHGGGHH